MRGTARGSRTARDRARPAVDARPSASVGVLPAGGRAKYRVTENEEAR